MVPLTGQNTINDMVDRINEVGQEIENVAIGNANAVRGPASSVVDQIMAFSDTTGKSAKAANISTFVYSILDDADDAAVRATLGLKSAAVLDAAAAATANTVVQRDASGNITGVGITATSGFVGNGSQITSLNMGNVASGTLAVANGGTGTTTSTGTGSVVRSASPTFTGAPLSTTASADTNTTQIATTAFVIGQASSVSPAMNGTATIGTSLRYARADHVHPSDTSKVNTSLLGVANGVATLDSGGKVPTSQLPAYVDDVLEYTNLASFPATGETGKIYVAIDMNKTYRWSGSAYIYITSGAVDSVAGKTGVVTLVKSDVGLGNVDNTSDVNKPVSTAQQSALALKANIASPELTGVPTAPTADVGTNTTQLATTAYTVAEIGSRAPTKTGTGASGTWGISVTGNAATATKLETARTINGVAFDGTANITVADSTKVPLTSTTGAAVIPAGTEAQRPASPVNGHLRYNSEKSQFEGYQGGDWKPIGGGDSSPMFSVMWWPQRSAVPAGYVAADGQTLSRATYPDAWAGIQAGNVPTVADATWNSTPTERGKFTVGDGTTTFRLPDYNGKFAGSLGAVFLRGDGTLSAAISGVIQRDAFQGHRHSGSIALGGSINLGTSTQYIQTSNTGDPVSDGVNGTPRAAAETRPLNVTGCWVIKLFGAVVNVGSADAAQLASDYANLASRTTSLEAGIKQMPELLWSGSVGSNWVTLNLSRPLVEGDIIWLQHNDANKLNSHPIVLTQELLAGGRTTYFVFASGGVTGLIITSASQLTTAGFTSGYGIEKIYASRAKN